MDLKSNVVDIDIDLGSLINESETVRIKFRRRPSIEVVTFLRLLADSYSWKVDESDEFFYIYCTGAASDDVGNAIAEKLSNDHGLKVRLCQYIDMKKPGHSRWTVGVDKLRLVHEKVD